MTAYTDSEKYRQDVRQAVKRYNEKLDVITVRVPKGKKEEYYTAAEKAGMSFKQFMMQALQEKIDRM